METSHKRNFYCLFKSKFTFEHNLVKLRPIDRKRTCSFLTFNLKLPIETGRWTGVPRHERLCNLCNDGVGDEFHYLFYCKHQLIVNFRQKFIPKYFYINPNLTKAKGMFSSCNTRLLSDISRF